MYRKAFTLLLVSSFIAVGFETICPELVVVGSCQLSAQEAVQPQANDGAQNQGQSSEPMPAVEGKPVGQGSGLWKWTPKAAYHQAIVEVTTESGSGTGVLIDVNKEKKVKDGHEGYVLTAWHVIQDQISGGMIKVTYRNQRRARGCKVLSYDEDKDIAILWVWVPEGYEPAKLATQPVKRGDKLELAGLGGGTDLACCIRAFEAQASPPSSIEKIFADVPLLPGDSGGPVFNSNHEVVGIISGGWFWWDSGLKTADGSYIRTTWPARASNVGPIQEMVANLAPKHRIASAATTGDSVQRTDR